MSYPVWKLGMGRLSWPKLDAKLSAAREFTAEGCSADLRQECSGRIRIYRHLVADNLLNERSIV